MKNNLKILMKENNRLEEELSNENNLAITNIILYIKFQNISQVDIELIRKDLIGMALECQIRDKSFNTLIGSDYKVFSDNLIATLSKEPPIKRLLDFGFIATMSMLMLFLLNLNYLLYF